MGAPAGGISSTPGVGRASLLAAQAREAMRANEVSTEIDDDLLKTYCISSIESRWLRREKLNTGKLFFWPPKLGGCLTPPVRKPQRSFRLPSCFCYIFWVY